jgi:hypothetical protein
VRAEDAFIDEWLAYHRLLGVAHFLIYDDDPRQHLRGLLAPHAAYITVFNWSDFANFKVGRNRQTQAYEHAVTKSHTAWIAFIDIDEFIVLRQHLSIGDFLSSFDDVAGVALTWHMFGHNGYFVDPPGLITEALTKRQRLPGNMKKLIARREMILAVRGAHVCKMSRPKSIVDANHRLYTPEHYRGKTHLAHINHYFCRSFETWMRRVTRGEVAYAPGTYPPREAWRFQRDACLRKFVEIAATCNEVNDAYMTTFSDSIKRYLRSLGKTAYPIAD